MQNGVTGKQEDDRTIHLTEMDAFEMKPDGVYGEEGRSSNLGRQEIGESQIALIEKPNPQFEHYKNEKELLEDSVEIP